MRTLLTITAILLLLTGGLYATAPTLISYQGYLADSMGDPLTGTVSVVFSIWDAESGGTQLWTETHGAVAVDNGAFNVILGSTTPVTADLFADSVRYLQISVGGDDIVPRSRLVSVPYAHHVSTLDGATSGVIEGPLVISPSDFDSLGNGIVVLNNNGNPQLIVTVDNNDVAAVSIIEPEDSKANGRAVGSKIAELNRDGLTLFGATEADTTAEIRPNGDIRAINTISVGQSASNSGVNANVLGFNNIAAGDSATISGGFSNAAIGVVSTISGGSFNAADGDYSTVSGGTFNSADGNRSTVGGGGLNEINADEATVGGGQSNFVGSFAPYSTIAGGRDNSIEAVAGTIGGGTDNVLALATAGSTISGGRNNTVNGTLLDATIGGGNGNAVSAFANGATIAGGLDNTADGETATVGGGDQNLAGANYATVPGGQLNEAEGIYSLAAGRRAKANSAGCFVWADHTDADFSSTASDQFLVRAAGGVGINTNSPSTALHVNGDICYTGSIGACSDERYKTDVSTLNNALERVMKLRGVRYHWRIDEYPEQEFEDGNQIGFIAQEIEQLFPELVLTDKQGYKSVDYSKLTPVLVEAMKQQQATIERLIKRVDELESRITQ